MISMACDHTAERVAQVDQRITYCSYMVKKQDKTAGYMSARYH